MHPWSLLCPVDVSALTAWLAESAPAFPDPSTPVKPLRVRELPAHAGLVIEAVLPRLGEGLFADGVCLSRVLPGQSHPLHVDTQRADWITRVHVPLTTNDGCWFEWEGEGRAHFPVGYAYSFDTTARHAFGNDGVTERVHLLFDVRRAG